MKFNNIILSYDNIEIDSHLIFYKNLFKNRGEKFFDGQKTF